MTSILLLLLLFQPTSLKPSEAAKAAGTTATVCGKITRTYYAQRAKGKPTFLDMGRDFTIVIWGRDRSRFGKAPETEFRDREACSTGPIGLYRGRAQTIVTRLEQIKPQN